MVSAILLAAAVALTPADHARTKRQADEARFFRALRDVEGSPHGADGGRAIGVYSVRWSYWRDALKADPTLATVRGWRSCDGRAYAERVVRTYLRHYSPLAWADGNWFMLAQVHHAGVTGAASGKGRDYARRVCNCMQSP
jgi:hypothetical protein